MWRVGMCMRMRKPKRYLDSSAYDFFSLRRYIFSHDCFSFSAGVKPGLIGHRYQCFPSDLGLCKLKFHH